ncbi:hypothetical protein [Caproicibacter fermentans]|uniref:Uncharacterized protein n=1 Tax=Caproicibacter fermentans TaxID=2576756 RepID=A0A7G8TD16_9FIRM|nr:hypothetical protein [Caproicibacter fermentans]QNK41507.1 hypothetical protein HCR03_04350 [Caproicibacter fermentans]
MKRLRLKVVLLISCIFSSILIINLSGCSGKLPFLSKTEKSMLFSDGYDKANVTIEKVKISDGNTGKSFETEDQEMIRSLFDELDTQKLSFRDGSLASGWSYSIDCTCKGISGQFSYTLDSGFVGYDGYSGKLITGFYVADDYDSIYKTLQNFYNELSTST